MDDFESIELTIPFESAGPLRQAKRVEVPILDDNIYEENEEFLLYFDVVGSNNLDTITTTPMHNPFRCRIMDDESKLCVCNDFFHLFT